MDDNYVTAFKLMVHNGRMSIMSMLFTNKDDNRDKKNLQPAKN